jgi:hypothetical protein
MQYWLPDTDVCILTHPKACMVSALQGTHSFCTG